MALSEEEREALREYFSGAAKALTKGTARIQLGVGDPPRGEVEGVSVESEQRREAADSEKD